MKVPFVRAKQVLTFICALPFPSDIEWGRKFLSIFFIVCAFTSQICGISASAAFVFKFISTNLELSLFAISAGLTFFSMAYSILFGLYLRPKMLIMFENLLKIHAAGK